MRRVSMITLLVACGPSLATEAEEPPGDPIADVAAEDLFQMGVVQARRGDLIRSEQYIGAAIARGFPKQQALPILLRVCVAGSRLRAALAHAEPYLIDHPEDWALRYLVASIQLGLGDLEEARSSLDRVIETAPEEASPRYLLGVVLAKSGENGEARRRFEQYLEMAPEGEQAVAATEALSELENPDAPVTAPEQTESGDSAGIEDP